MNLIGIWAMPVTVGMIVLLGLFKGVDVFQTFLSGAAKGLETGVKILPSLIGLMLSISMFKASGALDVLSFCVQPAADLIRFPVQAVPLALLRPVSGGGAIALLNNLLNECGADSFAGRAACVFGGCFRYNVLCSQSVLRLCGYKKYPTHHTVGTACGFGKRSAQRMDCPGFFRNVNIFYFSIPARSKRRFLK